MAIKQARHLAPAEDSVFRKGFLEFKQMFIENAKISPFWENFSVWEHCFIHTNREWKTISFNLLALSLLLCEGPYVFTMYTHLMPKLSKPISTLFLTFIRARSERGSRRLPRERSSETSKNCHKNYLYQHPNIHQRGNKSGRQIWAFFVAFSYAL